MKIAFLNIYQNVVDRGAETFVKELSSRLGEKYRVEIISGNQKPIRRWPFLWRFFIDPSGLAILKFTLKNIGRIWREKYNVVIPLNGGWMPAILRLITWLYGGKMIISGQSGIGWDDRNNLWCFPDIFIALSSQAKTWAKKNNPFIKTVYIPNGADVNTFNPRGPKIRINLKKPIILCVGALTKSKRIDLVIRTVAKMSDVSLLIVGDGELKEELLKLGKEQLGKRFQLIKLPYKEISKAYRVANLFTLPSMPQQSFEIVLVEAMATNLPVVVNNDPIRKEIIGDAGVLVKPENIDIYAKALEIALYNKWGNKPRKRAEEFSWDKIAIKYEKLIKKL